MTEQAHKTHCNQGEYVGSCKYGDDGCPAMTEHVRECTSESGHRWELRIEMWGRELHVTARCIWQECEATINENEIESYLNADTLEGKDVS